jgi:hypothetical protein
MLLRSLSRSTRIDRDNLGPAGVAKRLTSFFAPLDINKRVDITRAPFNLLQHSPFFRRCILSSGFSCHPAVPDGTRAIATPL